MSSEKMTTIGDVAEIFDGPHATPQKIESGPYFLSISSLNKGILDLNQSAHLSEEDFKKWTKRVTPKPGDILFSYETRLGEAAMMPAGVRACLGRRMGLLRPDRSKVIPEFLLYSYLSPSFQSVIQQRKIHGATVDRIALKELPFFPIRIPSLKEQQKVVDCLKGLDSKIQLNHQINQTLEQMAQAIFKSWFVDFEPVKAKMEAKKRWHALQPGNEPASPVCYAGEPQPLPDLDSYMNLAAMQAISGKTPEQLARMEREQPDQYARLRATAELFPSAMQPSELGEIPEGWEVSEIGKEVNVVGGGTPSTKNPEFWEGGNIHWTTPKDLSNLADKVLINTDRKITSKGLAKISSGLLPVDTVLMSSRAPVGYLALAKIPVAVNQGYIAMICEKRLSPEYVIQWASANMDEIKSRASGTTFAEISKKNFKIIPVIVPTDDVVSAYSLYVKNMYSEIEAKIRESHNLANLRDTLLPKLLSGEITVPEAEAQLAKTGEMQA
ncbi:restriction endonuclease subunit S [Microbulbifer thermotolerans]|uniref:restriction endonuclease subunit S n=1 Tax=Microbulbifer thermotolerans TaxID=252514 RepID=UPI00224B1211|nr:restriction endonuclease subunit S [Microbulbifer thermotolerans]MCX2782829.1 restriction endonuclease subunit S [Microbulbifer thermotolerans]